MLGACNERAEIFFWLDGSSSMWKRKWENMPQPPDSSGIFPVYVTRDSVMLWEWVWHWVLWKAHRRNTRLSALALFFISWWRWKMSTKSDSWKCWLAPGRCLHFFLPTLILTMNVLQVCLIGLLRPVPFSKCKTKDRALSWTFISPSNVSCRWGCGQAWMRAIGGNKAAWFFSEILGNRWSNWK